MQEDLKEIIQKKKLKYVNRENNIIDENGKNLYNKSVKASISDI